MDVTTRWVIKDLMAMNGDRRAGKKEADEDDNPLSQADRLSGLEDILCSDIIEVRQRKFLSLLYF